MRKYKGCYNDFQGTHIEIKTDSLGKDYFENEMKKAQEQIRKKNKQINKYIQKNNFDNDTNVSTSTENIFKYCISDEYEKNQNYILEAIKLMENNGAYITYNTIYQFLSGKKTNIIFYCKLYEYSDFYGSLKNKPNFNINSLKEILNKLKNTNKILINGSFIKLLY